MEFFFALKDPQREESPLRQQKFLAEIRDLANFLPPFRYWALLNRITAKNDGRASNEGGKVNQPV